MGDGRAERMRGGGGALGSADYGEGIPGNPGDEEDLVLDPQPELGEGREEHRAGDVEGERHGRYAAGGRYRRLGEIAKAFGYHSNPLTNEDRIL
jgi:hypothetical protein